MRAHDFEFDGKRLSEFGFVICNFDSKGLETIDGVSITFNTVSTLNGEKHKLTSVQYEDCLQTTIQVCKYSCSSDVEEISSHEFSDITRWLQRKKFLKFKILSKEYIDVYYEAAFTKINEIEINGKLIGLELEIITNRPFALKEPKIINIVNTVQDGIYSLNDTSCEEGYIYPHTEITIKENGNLNIYNALENRNTYIANCVAGEVITMDYPIISSSIESHYIQNDFNWNFFRIANTFENRRNDLTISIPCIIKVKYSPIVKVGL